MANYWWWLGLNAAAVAINYHFGNAVSFSRGLFYLEECLVNYLLPAPSNLTNLERLVAWNELNRNPWGVKVVARFKKTFFDDFLFLLSL